MKKRGKTLFADCLGFSSLFAFVIAVAEGVVWWALGVGAEDGAFSVRCVVAAVERSVATLARLCNEDEFVELLKRDARWRRYWFDCWINGDAGACKQEFKLRIQALTNWVTLSNREGALGNFRCDKRKNASIKAVNGKPKMQKKQKW